jgi:hypothetical protein
MSDTRVEEMTCEAFSSLVCGVDLDEGFYLEYKPEGQRKIWA